MSDEPAAFPARYRKEFTPDPDIVRECETLLEQARSGQLRAFAVALVFHDNLVPSMLIRLTPTATIPIFNE